MTLPKPSQPLPAFLQAKPRREPRRSPPSFVGLLAPRGFTQSGGTARLGSPFGDTRRSQRGMRAPRPRHRERRTSRGRTRKAAQAQARSREPALHIEPVGSCPKARRGRSRRSSRRARRCRGGEPASDTLRVRRRTTTTDATTRARRREARRRRAPSASGDKGGHPPRTCTRSETSGARSSTILRPNLLSIVTSHNPVSFQSTLFPSILNSAVPCLRPSMASHVKGSSFGTKILSEQTMVILRFVRVRIV